MAFVDTIIGFVIALLLGALGIYVGARVITNVDDYGYAIFTALIGALVWWLVTLFLGWIPFLGLVLALLAWVAVINWRYPGGWVDAAIIGVVAWVVVVVVVYLVSAVFGWIPPDAVGIPTA